MRVQVDGYGTQTALALLRQHIEYGYWFDRTKLAQKVIQDCQYVAAMNPSAGSFNIDPRLQVTCVSCRRKRNSAALYRLFLVISVGLSHISSHCLSSVCLASLSCDYVPECL